eukprot:363138-Chlamydomonas_euryale.AAC.4
MPQCGVPHQAKGGTALRPSDSSRPRRTLRPKHAHSEAQSLVAFSNVAHLEIARSRLASPRVRVGADICGHLQLS